VGEEWWSPPVPASAAGRRDRACALAHGMAAAGSMDRSLSRAGVALGGRDETRIGWDRRWRSTDGDPMHAA
jgi:hypothetical protein